MFLHTQFGLGPVHPSSYVSKHGKGQDKAKQEKSHTEQASGVGKGLMQSTQVVLWNTTLLCKSVLHVYAVFV